MKKILLLILGFTFIFPVFAGLKITAGTQNFNDSPAVNINSIQQLGAELNFGIPILKIDVLLEQQVGADVKGGENLAMATTSYGIRKKFLKIFEPYFALGRSDNKINYSNNFDIDTSKTYKSNWLSLGINFNLAIIKFGADYRINQAESVNVGNSSNLSTSSQSFYFSLGF